MDGQVEMMYRDFFSQMTGHEVYSHQVRFAEEELHDIVINVPTGCGKTEMAVLTWLYHRVERGEREWPRRLVLCFPLRSLVHQTYERVSKWLSRMPEDKRPPVYMAMGGRNDREWLSRPEDDAIIIGTQDMLVSQAINHAYTLSCKIWPMCFGLLNNDSLWVMDEIQLMGDALATTLQMSHFREKHGTWKKCYSWWMSATINDVFLVTVDHPRRAPVFRLLDDEKKELKRIITAPKEILRSEAIDAKEVVSEVVDYIQSGGPGPVFIVVNRVKRGQEIYRLMTKKKVPSVLLHSRFRGVDRKRNMDTFMGSGVKVVISTQVIEAGMDVSCAAMWTDVASWNSMVQRFGRCNRSGEHRGAFIKYILLPGSDAKSCYPYLPEEIDLSIKALSDIDDASPETLATINVPMSDSSAFLNVIRNRDILDLFHSDMDVVGGRMNVDGYVRDRRNSPDVYVFWRDFVAPDEQELPHRDELCPVRMDDFKKYFKKMGGKMSGKRGAKAYSYDSDDDTWRPLGVEDIEVGCDVMLKTGCGGYTSGFGWTGKVGGKVEEVVMPVDVLYTGKVASKGVYETIKEHSKKVVVAVKSICSELAEIELPVDDMVRAALMHDIGKAHPEWQGKSPDGGPWAKFGEYRPPCRVRHCVASALGCWGRLEKGWSFLSIYLIGSHHGFLRSMGRRRRRDAPGSVFGVSNGDVIPPVPGLTEEEIHVSVSPCRIGCGGGVTDGGDPSWNDRYSELLSSIGPFRLAYMEALFRAADWRASKNEVDG